MAKENNPTPARMLDILSAFETEKKHTPIVVQGSCKLTAEEYIQNAKTIAAGLLSLGIQRGDVVAILSDNRTEWLTLDMGVQLVGARLLPLCKGLTAEEYVDCINGSNTTILIIEDTETIARFKLILPQFSTIKEIVSIEDSEQYLSLKGLLAKGAEHNYESELAHRQSLCSGDDICTLYYIGGGAFTQLTHKIILAEIEEYKSLEEGKRQGVLITNPICTRYGRNKMYAHLLRRNWIEFPPLEGENSSQKAPQQRKSKLAAVLMQLF